MEFPCGSIEAFLSGNPTAPTRRAMTESAPTPRAPFVKVFASARHTPADLVATEYPSHETKPRKGLDTPRLMATSEHQYDQNKCASTQSDDAATNEVALATHPDNRLALSWLCTSARTASKSSSSLGAKSQSQETETLQRSPSPASPQMCDVVVNQSLVYKYASSLASEMSCNSLQPPALNRPQVSQRSSFNSKKCPPIYSVSVRSKPPITTLTQTDSPRFARPTPRPQFALLISQSPHPLGPKSG